MEGEYRGRPGDCPPLLAAQGATNGPPFCVTAIAYAEFLAPTGKAPQRFGALRQSFGGSFWR